MYDEDSRGYVALERSDEKAERPPCTASKVNDAEEQVEEQKK